MHDVVIVSAVRTPIGKIRGVLSDVRPDDLAALVVRSAVKRAGVDPALVEEVYLGCANQAGEDARNVARTATLLAGLPYSTAAITVNRLCASGMSAVNQAARAIRCGEAEVLVAGGVESMTRAPYSIPKNAQPFGPSGNVTAWDTSLGWRYPNPALEAIIPLESMGETAENIATMSRAGQIRGGEITRQDQDAFALQSQQRAIKAINEGRFRREIVPVTVTGPVSRKDSATLVDIDEQPFYRKTDSGYELATSMDKLSRLRPAFREGGSVTAGNSSGLNDGASSLVLMNADRAAALGIKPLARWLGSAVSGIDPRIMGLGPVEAVRKLLARAQVGIDALDLIELNEAFAVQAIAVMRELELPHDRTNVNGGAIALGHPLGSSGARILTTLIYELQRRASLQQAARYGLAALCVGVGQGEATLIEYLP